MDHQYVLEALASGDFRLTLHAKKRMSQRNISAADIRACGESGQVTPEDGGKCRVEGSGLDGEELTVICADEDGVLVVTVY